MKKFFVLCLVMGFGLLVFGSSNKVSAQNLNERITSFHSNIEINQNTSIDIKEIINYETSFSKHGIYRYIPITYNENGVKTKHKISNVRVTDADGLPIYFKKSNDSKFLTLKIGDPSSTFTGSKTYLIYYQVENAIKHYDDYDELYWDITGEGWTIPILDSSAIIDSQYANIEAINCFSGKYGNNDGLCKFNNLGQNRVSFSYNTLIKYGSNFTIALKLNKNNQLIFPGVISRTISWFRYNWSIFLIPLPIIFIFLWWYKEGRDYIEPKILKPLSLSSRIPMVYEPLKDLSPGEAGLLIDEKVDTQDIVAEILELARKKYLKIEQIDKKVLVFESKDYKLTKQKEADDQLPEVQKYLLKELFAKKSETTVSELKGKFYKKMQKASNLISEELVKRKIFTNDPTKVRAAGTSAFIVLIVIVSSIAFWQLIPWQIFWPVIVIALEVPIGLILAHNLSQRSAVGHNLYLQAKGLKVSIKRGAWREKIKEKHLFIEEVLPFAVSLGVVKELSKQMEELNIQAPEYFHAANIAALSTSEFVSSFSSDLGNSLSYNPSSSSSSGSGFGGGGFSGGGGGGGGGGSW